MRDDIDWTNASSDLGLAQLCREMAALARPIEMIMKRPGARVRRARRTSTSSARPA